VDNWIKLLREGVTQGITSVCSAHPLILRAALRHGVKAGSTVLIEATCNQVNHQGGYTGMLPADFAALVAQIAEEEGCPAEQIVLGGDHLGPNPWRELKAEDALVEAEKMIAAYVSAGFRKIHLDTSMGCLGEPEALDDKLTAERSARLATVAEDVATQCGDKKPFYIIGTEVPPPGGADHTLSSVEPTSSTAAKRTIAVHRNTFHALGQEEAFTRVIGLVVQPGVEFGNRNVIAYDRTQVQALIRVLEEEPQISFEAHSTDYQGQKVLGELVEDGFSILKVGPELTFVLRESLYALDLIASDLLPDYGQRPLYSTMEALMVAQPAHWNRHYDGDSAEGRVLRHYSLSDRIRYYWATPEAQTAYQRLVDALTDASVPISLFRQHLPCAESFADKPLDPESLMMWCVERTLKHYHAACEVSTPETPLRSTD